jgi:hypothetical protein
MSRLAQSRKSTDTSESTCILAPMFDSGSKLAEPGSDAPVNRAPYLPFAAYAPPSRLTTPAPSWTRAYELPSARGVVSAGLQLALASSVTIRRASLYIGLLSLGAFGPAAVLLLIGLARLLSDPATAATITGDDPTLIFFEQPDLAGPLTLIYAVAIVGVILLVAISIDAVAIAISLLGGSASESPLLLREAVTRARQVFWRLLVSGLLVGLASALVSFIVASPFLRPLDTNQGITFIASMLGTLAVTPFAFAATGIVLGDAGAIETLRRSVRLFRARPRIALVVTLFTLVTSAIQSFALGGGADIAFRVADFFHVGQGGAALILPGILVLAFIVAFGSLTFTIAAIVAAPQVSAFLGLTFYSAGLDQARTPANGPPRRARWVSIPMSIVMVGLGVVVVLGIPMIASFRPHAASPLLAFLRDSAATGGEQIAALGVAASAEDPAGDVRGPAGAPWMDIIAGDAGWLPNVPTWLLDEFRCGAAGVTCSAGGSEDAVFLGGGVVYLQRMAAGPETVPVGHIAEWGPTFAVYGEAHLSALTDVQFSGSTQVYLTRRLSTTDELIRLQGGGGALIHRSTDARSRWIGTDLITIIPASELFDLPEFWDVYAGERGSSSSAASVDTLRPDDGAPLLPFVGTPMFLSLPSFAP